MCLVTDRRRLAPGAPLAAQRRALVAQAGAAAAAGVDLFQLRERDLTGGMLTAIADECVSAVTGTHTLVVVNDRLDVAIGAGAHGVHLPAAGIGAARVRALLGPQFLIGCSIHGGDEPGGGADAAIFGTVFPSASKDRNHAWAGVEGLEAAARRARVPVLAIGGVTAVNIEQVAAICAGVAAIGWFATTDARQLTEAVSRARKAFDTITPLI